MKLLVAVSSCQSFEENGSNQTIRDCWLNECSANGLDYKFFHGHGAEPKDDVVLVDCPDDYGHLTFKTRENRRWALANGYDFVFQCFPDTYCRPERLVCCGFQDFDYFGDFRSEHASPDNYPSGGCGYWTSRRVNELLLDAPITGVWRDDITPYAEDLWIGKILARYAARGLKYFDNPNFINRGTRGDGPLKSNTIISTHLSCPDRYYPERMWEKHSQWLRSQQSL
jgi:hypothetical protein